jgi:hypothetical protein
MMFYRDLILIKCCELLVRFFLILNFLWRYSIDTSFINAPFNFAIESFII